MFSKQVVASVILALVLVSVVSAVLARFVGKK